MNVKIFFSAAMALLVIFSSCSAARADDDEMVILFTCRGKAYKNGDTLVVTSKEKLSIAVKVFVKQFKVKGGIWKKNKKGEWRFYKEVKGCTVGIGVGKMTMKILKEDYLWRLDGARQIGSDKILSWTAPSLPGDSHNIACVVKAVGQVKTEGSASLHGFHVDYNLPGAGKRTFSGKSTVRLKVEKAS
ncbi:MAG: hypothetical protein AB2L14_31180 [Candidatus Xenobiia bacterium LiM19]